MIVEARAKQHEISAFLGGFGDAQRPERPATQSAGQDEKLQLAWIAIDPCDVQTIQNFGIFRVDAIAQRAGGAWTRAT